MGTLRENSALHNRVSVFQDRTEAGKLLAEHLAMYRGSGGIVLAIPSGGVPVAVQISLALDLPLDLIIARKLQLPGNPEAGCGAMGPDGEVIFNEGLMKRLGLTEDDVRRQRETTKDTIEKRNRIFRGGIPFPEIKGRIVIVVDDGLASGYTMLSAVRFLRRESPKKVVIAVPTAAEGSAHALLPEVDELLCLNVRGGTFFAVAEAYRKWHDVGDEEVLSVMKGRRGSLRAGYHD